MATGGEDRRLKLWAVGKPTCILSLTGHTSSIEASEFSQEEDRVAAGSLSGSIRIWDLEEVKTIKTLDFHPYGNFVASGSMDTLVKLWDVSRKGCINTYRGHTGPVNMIRFSPDGKWIVSAGEDGIVKLWDLSAGRQLAELVGHTGPVVAVTFHPTVLLLATASTDHTVRLYDLENFTQVAVTGPELNATNVRRIAFHPDGVCLYVATNDYLRIYDYENMSCLETVHVGWRAGGGLDDMAIAPSFNQLVGVCILNSLITTYVVDVKSCIPFTTHYLDNIVESNKSVCVQSSQSNISCVNTSASNCDNNSTNNIPTMHCVQQIYGNSSLTNYVHSQQNSERPFTRCGSSSSRIQSSAGRKSFCLVAEENLQNVMSEDPNDPDARLPYQPTTEDSELFNAADITDPDEYDRIFKPHHTVPRSPSQVRIMTSKKNVLSEHESDPTAKSSFNLPASSKSIVNPKEIEAKCSQLNVLSDGFTSDKPFLSPSQITSNPHQLPEAVEVEEFLSQSLPIMMDFSFNSVPQNQKNFTADKSSSFHEPSEAELLLRIRKPHDPFMKVMSSRVKGLSTIRVMWSPDSVKTAVESALMMNDAAILIDVLGILAKNSKYWNLDLVIFLLPQLVELIHSKYTTHVETTCQIVRVIIKNFAQVIRQTIESPTPPGVDLMREERRRKCQECLTHLLTIRSALGTKDVASKAGQCGRELNVMFQLLV
ncbi:Katanin p80 WD40 repeat-containing subunit B1 [Schistosoma japonicum]|nr:Katanin p80 WD40 repeat-containing subunit B1 [Schistosoma japonicum]